MWEKNKKKYPLIGLVSPDIPAGFSLEKSEQFECLPSGHTGFDPASHR